MVYYQTHPVLYQIPVFTPYKIQSVCINNCCMDKHDRKE